MLFEINFLLLKIISKNIKKKLIYLEKNRNIDNSKN